MYDAQIARVRQLLRGLPVRSYAYDEAKAWPENADFVMIFQKDAAFELGGKGLSANLTLVTEDAEAYRMDQADSKGLWDGDARMVRKDETPADQILVYGPELQEIQGDVSYARICEVLVRGEEDASLRTLKLLQDIDFEKFHIYGKGYMMRTSGQSAREQVRVSKKALQEGISFERMGDLFVSHYKKNPNVIAVRVIFITGDSFDYERLSKEAALALEIRNSLSVIQKGLPTECENCSIQEICAKVEGLRELHFGKKKADAAQAKARGTDRVRI